MSHEQRKISFIDSDRSTFALQRGCFVENGKITMLQHPRP